MTIRRNTVWCGVFTLLLALPKAHAQEATTSFDELGHLVQGGDTISITDTKGRDIRGKLEGLTSSSLTLMVDGQSQHFETSHVNTIRERHFDSLENGALWGFGAGAGTGSALGVLADGAVHPFFSLLFGAIGSGIGVAVDAAIQGEHTIYARPPDKSVPASGHRHPAGRSGYDSPRAQ